MKDDIQISTTQASEMLKCSYKTIINYCNSGKLTGDKNPVTGIWKISLNSVLKLQREMVIEAIGCETECDQKSAKI
ncbi:MAG: helix-turn-helix domain-containing protein [Planctomycetota bacterium]|jgi:hypothetical protein